MGALGLIPPCAKKLGFPTEERAVRLAVLATHRLPQPAFTSTAQQQKQPPHPNTFLLLNQLQAQWMPQLMLSRLPVTRLLGQFDFWVFCETLWKRFHHHCLNCNASLTWVLHPYCSADIQETHPGVVWQQTEGQHQHFVTSKLSYPYKVIWIVPEVWSLKLSHPLSNK